MSDFIDLHCHPAMKPYGHSFNRTPGKQPADPSDKRSVWYHQGPKALSRGLNKVAGLTKFRQSDFTSYRKGNGIICVATLYPLEKSFVRTKLGNGFLSRWVNNFVIGIGAKRIKQVQRTNNYFDDLMGEYEFYEQQNNKIVEIDGKKCRYYMVKSYSEIVQHRGANANSDVETIYVFMSIEGAHVFDPAVIHSSGSMLNYDDDLVGDSIPQVKANIDAMTSVDYPPKFITMAHHFSNHLCGHAESLSSPVTKLTSQAPQLNEPFLKHGKEVLRYLIDKGVLIDIKHMSIKTRNEYFQLIDDEYPDLPTVVSHGAANGLKSSANPVAGNPDLSDMMVSNDINFYDDEIVYLAEHDGIFGIQMDERRVASKKALKKAGKWFRSKPVRKKFKSELIWNQIRYIGELLDSRGLDAWDLQAIGSDFDGIVDPINLFWSSENFPDLITYLTNHANSYMNAYGSRLQAKNQVSGEEIIVRFMAKNAERFIEKNF